MNQAGELVDVAFGINIVVNTKSKHSKLFCGDFHDAWIKSCKYVDDCYGVQRVYSMLQGLLKKVEQLYSWQNVEKVEVHLISSVG